LIIQLFFCGIKRVEALEALEALGSLAKQNGIRSLLSLNGNKWQSLPMVAEWQSANH
jgi:hypothetical protein